MRRKSLQQQKHKEMAGEMKQLKNRGDQPQNPRTESRRQEKMVIFQKTKTEKKRIIIELKTKSVREK